MMVLLRVFFLEWSLIFLFAFNDLFHFVLQKWSVFDCVFTFDFTARSKHNHNPVDIDLLRKFPPIHLNLFHTMIFRYRKFLFCQL